VTVRDLRAGSNPVRSSTRISYTLAQAGPVSCAVYDGAGRRVAELFRGQQAAGEQSLTWNATGVGPGAYFVRIEGAAQGTVRLVKAE
jgi:flagellar hook assembly protein FlgD